MGKKKKGKASGMSRGFATTSQLRKKEPEDVPEPAPKSPPVEQPKPDATVQAAETVNSATVVESQDDAFDELETTLSPDEIRVAKWALNRKRNVKRIVSTTASSSCATLTVPHDTLNDAIEAINAYHAKRESEHTSKSASTWIQTCDLSKAYVSLLEAYAEISSLGFKDDVIIKALEVKGPSLDAALDWLCLNVDEHELPDGWYRENAQEVEKRKKLEAKLKREAENEQEIEQQQNLDSVTDKTEKNNIDKKVTTTGESINNTSKVNASPNNPKQSTKDWILQNYQQESSSDSDDGDYFAQKYGVSSVSKKTKKESKAKKTQEDIALEESVQDFEMRVSDASIEVCNEETSKLEAVMDVLKSRSKDPKIDKRENGLSIKATKEKQSILATRMEELRPDEEMVVIDSNGDEIANTDEISDEQGGLAGMFEECDVAEDDEHSPLQECTIVDCESQKWSGLSPSQLLQEYVTKLAGGGGTKGGNLPKYTKLKSRRGGMFRFSVTCFIEGKAMVVEMPPDQCCRTKTESHDLVALLMLWELAPEQSMYKRLAPVFRNLWNSWIAAKDKKKKVEELRAIETAHQLITDLMSRVSKTALEQVVNDSQQNQGPNAASSTEGEETSNTSEKSQSKRAHSKRSTWIADALQERQANPKSSYRKLEEFKRQLPVASIRDQVVETLLMNHETDAIIVCGQTGSGKTTQIPQYILEGEVAKGNGDTCRVVCTEPRRISAVSVAQRVSEEFGDPNCGGDHSFVGYQIKGDRRCRNHTPLVYCTTGVMLRRLQGDSDLEEITHLVVDEVHERTVQSDFLLIVLRRILQRQRQGKSTRRTPLKVVLMSATVDAEKLSRYFGGAPVIEAGGRTFPVRHFSLGDALELTGHRIDPGSPFALPPDRVGQDRNNVRVDMTRFGGGAMFVSGETIASAASQNSSNGDHESNVRMVSRPKPDETETSTTCFETKERFSDGTKASLSLADESKVNYDLIETIIEFIDREDPVEGARPKATSADDMAVRKSGGSVIHQEFSQSLQALRDAGKESKGENVSAILVFMPGMSQIKRLHDQLAGHRVFGDQRRYRVIALHSALATASAGAQQRQIFDPPPTGMRKIVIATNIAETGVTIPDVVYVIDSARVKELSFDSAKRVNRLEEKFVSQANALQRQGRAGRVRPGMCFRLVSNEVFDSLPAYTSPEIQRTSLEDLCLQVMMIHNNNTAARISISETESYFPSEFLSEALDPPSMSSVGDAMEHLVNIGAIEVESSEGSTFGVALSNTLANDSLNTPLEFENMPKGPEQQQSSITESPKRYVDDSSGFKWLNNRTSSIAVRLKPLGAHLGAMPLDVQIGKMLIYSCLMRCVDVVLTITASIDQKSPFYDSGSSGPGSNDGDLVTSQIWRKFNRGHSDLITLHNLYVSWRTYVDQQCKMKMKTSSLTRWTLEPRYEAEFCSKNKVSLSVLRAIRTGRKDLASTLVSLGFLPKGYSAEHYTGQSSPLPTSVADMNRNSLRDAVVCSVICAGLYPNLASVRLENSKRGIGGGTGGGAAPPLSLCTADNIVYRERGVKQLFLHKKSINYGAGVGPNVGEVARGVTEGGAPAHGGGGVVPGPVCSVYWNPGKSDRRTVYAVYMEKMKTSRTFIHDSTFVPSSGLALFAGGTKSLDVYHHDRRLLVDRWVELQTPPKTAVVFKYIREVFDDVLMDQLRNPTALLSDEKDESHAVDDVLQFVADLIVSS